MTEKDGMYALVGRPKSLSNSNTMNCVKEMKYTILFVNDSIKLFIFPNTRGSVEIINELIQATNAKIIKMSESFEFVYPKKMNIQNSYLNIELNAVYFNSNKNNRAINLDSANKKRFKVTDLWNSCSDYFEIDLLNLRSAAGAAGVLESKATFANSILNNLALNISLHLENKCLFSYSNSNSSSSSSDDYHLSNFSQEFYSSVSVNPVFIPLK
jgi:hypothetical protein